MTVLNFVGVKFLYILALTAVLTVIFVCIEYLIVFCLTPLFILIINVHNVAVDSVDAFCVRVS